MMSEDCYSDCVGAGDQVLKILSFGNFRIRAMVFVFQYNMGFSHRGEVFCVSASGFEGASLLSVSKRVFSSGFFISVGSIRSIRYVIFYDESS